MPSRAAQAAVSMAWLDWGPPAVSTTSAPLFRASASKNSSLRTLLPPRATPMRTSRLIYRFFPSSRLRFSILYRGVGSRPRGRLGKSVICFIMQSSRKKMVPARSGSLRRSCVIAASGVNDRSGSLRLPI